jgi:thymidylate synthase
MPINKVDQQHKDLIKKILRYGATKNDRTGVGTKSIFGHQLVYDLEEGFPLLTLRKIHTKSVIHEMLWFLGAYDQEKYGGFGNTNIRYLLDNGVTFWSDWPYYSYLRAREYRPELPDMTMKEFEGKIVIDDAFAKEFGSIGPGYGKQWLNYGGKLEVEKNGDENKFILTQGINQIDYLIQELKRDPDSRRLILDAWKVDEIEEMLLPPCHYTFQLWSKKIKPEHRFQSYSKWITKNKLPYGKPMEEFNFPERKLSMMLTIRSNDIGLGNPFNVAEYALLLHMIAQVVNMIPNKLFINIGDAHIYCNHIDQMKKLLERESYDLPEIILNKDIKNIQDFRYDDIKIENYKAHSNIKMDVAV